MDKNKLLRQYLDGVLTPEEEQQVLHQIADDVEMRTMLRFELTLSESLADGIQLKSKHRVPEGFTDSVMLEIEQREEASESEGLWQKIEQWARQLWVPTQVIWRPAYVFVVAALLLFSFSYPLFFASDLSPSELNMKDITEQGSSVQEVSSTANEVLLRFVYIGNEAESIAVAGDFSNWEPIKMTRQIVNGEQVWTGLVSMNRGEHHYMFVKDGKEWITDPLATVQHDDGFGNKNAVVYI